MRLVNNILRGMEMRKILVLLGALLLVPASVNAEIVPGAVGTAASLPSGFTSVNPGTCNSSQSICEGTYTPAFSSLTNITGSPSTPLWNYIKIYNMVYVQGTSDINLVAGSAGAGTATLATVTIPIARSAVFTEGKAAGTGKEDDGGNSTWSIRSNNGSTTSVLFRAQAQNTGNKNVEFHFSYRLN